MARKDHVTNEEKTPVSKWITYLAIGLISGLVFGVGKLAIWESLPNSLSSFMLFGLFSIPIGENMIFIIVDKQLTYPASLFIMSPITMGPIGGVLGVFLSRKRYPAKEYWFAVLGGSIFGLLSAVFIIST